MKKALILFLLLSSAHMIAQKNVFHKKGIAIKGYDVVAYFNGKAVQGSSEFSSTYDGVKYYFSSNENKVSFIKNPKDFLPQYGGFCAYAMGVKGSKVSINPKTFEIRDNKLYLFYNKGRTNTLSLWLDNNPEELKNKADKNWLKSIKK